MTNKEWFLNNYNNLKAWCIVCGTDDYVWGCIRFAQRMKWLKSKYQTIVVCPSTLNQNTFDLLSQNNINYKIIYDKNLNDLFEKIKSFNPVTEYTAYSVLNLLLPLGIDENILLYMIDGDKLPLVNIDYYFDLQLKQDTIFNIYDFNNTLSGKKYFYLGEYFCRPNSELFNKLLNFCLLTNTLQSEIVLTNFIENNSDYTNSIEIIKDTFEKDITKICHFQGLLKPWNSILPAVNEWYTKYSYEKFNLFIDNHKEFIYYLNYFILCTNRLFINKITDMYAIDANILKKIQDLYYSLEQHNLL